ncbi:hypothetical protein ACOMHN_014735 [Nucella lapillus]
MNFTGNNSTNSTGNEAFNITTTRIGVATQASTPFYLTIPFLAGTGGGVVGFALLLAIIITITIQKKRKKTRNMPVAVMRRSMSGRVPVSAPVIMPRLPPPPPSRPMVRYSPSYVSEDVSSVYDNDDASSMYSDAYSGYSGTSSTVARSVY